MIFRSRWMNINTKLQQLSELNQTIAHEIFVNADYDGVNYGPNDLLDQRNTIIDDLSRYGKLEVISLDQGRIQVKLGGKLVVDANGGSCSNESIRIGLDGTTLSWEMCIRDRSRRVCGKNSGC